MIRTTMVVAGLLAFVGPAAAGPIPSGYKVESLGATFAPADRIPGYLTFHPNTQSLWLDPTPLGSAVPVSAPIDPSWSNVSDRFDLKLRLTDVASGQSGVVDLTGTAWASFENKYEDGPVPDVVVRAWGNSLAGDGSPARLTLGDTRYLIGLGDSGFTEGWDPSIATVTVVTAPAAVQTPEPGTFALAAFGLLPMGGLIRWRRAG